MAARGVRSELAQLGARRFIADHGCDAVIMPIHLRANTARGRCHAGGGHALEHAGIKLGLERLSLFVELGIAGAQGWQAAELLGQLWVVRPVTPSWLSTQKRVRVPNVQARASSGTISEETYGTCPQPAVVVCCMPESTGEAYSQPRHDWPYQRLFRPSPSRLKPKTVKATAIPGNSGIHHASLRNCWALRSI